jgi:hypothetical protein
MLAQVWIDWFSPNLTRLLEMLNLGIYIYIEVLHLRCLRSYKSIWAFHARMVHNTPV